jgi:hypothetical protein
LAEGQALHAQQNSFPQKYALVIGNGNYTGITRLRNPENDAADSPDGTRIVSASRETRSMVRVWDPAREGQ